MSDLVLFTLSVAALLAIPGPTNALLLVVGGQAVPRDWPAFSGAVVAAYLLAVGTLAALGETAAQELPEVGIALRIGLAAYLAWIALRTWRIRPAVAAPATMRAGVRDVFLVTLLNPKSAVIAFAILPLCVGTIGYGAAATVLTVLVLALATAWIAAGRLVAARAVSGGSALPFRLSALVLAGFAVVIGGSLVRDLTG